MSSSGTSQSYALGVAEPVLDLVGTGSQFENPTLEQTVGMPPWMFLRQDTNVSTGADTGSGTFDETNLRSLAAKAHQTTRIDRHIVP